MPCSKKPPTAQSERVKEAASDVAWMHEDLLVEFKQLLKVEALHKEGKVPEIRLESARVDYQNAFKWSMEAVKKLVRLDNQFLKHPLIQAYLLYTSREGLRKFHRGLEKGKKRPLTLEESKILNTLIEEMDKGGEGWIERARKALVNRRIIKKGSMSRQAFHKRAQRLLSSVRVYDAFSRSAIPAGEIPDYVMDALPNSPTPPPDDYSSLREALEIDKWGRQVKSILLFEPKGWMYRRQLQQVASKKGIKGKEFAEALKHLEEMGQVSLV